MGLRQGDTLTIRRGATIQLTQYDTLKPQVVLTRVMGEDPEADRADMERVAYVELRAAVIEEVLTRRRFDKIMGDDGNLTSLLQHCEKVVRRGYDKAKAGSIGFGEDARATEGGSASVRRKRRRE